MRNRILLAGIALLSLPLALPVQAQNNGNTGNNGQRSEKSKSADHKGGASEGASRADKGTRKANVRIPDVAHQTARSQTQAAAKNGGEWTRVEERTRV